MLPYGQSRTCTYTISCTFLSREIFPCVFLRVLMFSSFRHLPLKFQVGRAGVEPAEPLAPDLQSGPLPHTVYRPIKYYNLHPYSYLIPRKSQFHPHDRFATNSRFHSVLTRLCSINIIFWKIAWTFALQPYILCLLDYRGNKSEPQGATP